MARMTLNKSGSFINFLSPEKANIKSLKVHFSPKQSGSGDPTPENVRPISGWNGVEVYQTSQNLLPLNLPSAAFYGVFGTGDTSIASAGTRKCFTIYVGKNKTLYFQKTGTAGISIAFCDEPYASRTDAVIYDALNMANRYLAILESGDHPYAIISMFIASMPQGEIYDTTECMLSFGNSEKTYTPRADITTFPISWTQQGTVYGGYVDLVSGELWAEWGIVDLGTLKWNISGSTGSSTFYNNSGEISVKYDEYVPKWVCSKYKSVAFRTASSTADCYVWVDSGGRVRVKDTSLSNLTTEQFKEAVSGVQFSYELVTPVRYQLSPNAIQTLINTNNFWSNADYIDIEYELAESRDIQSVRKRIMLDNQPHKDAASGQLVNFATDLVSPLKKCKINFLPKQSGSGDPSPTNIRPISGWDGVSVTRCGKNLWNPVYIGNAGSSYTNTDTGIRVTSTREGTYLFVGFRSLIIGYSNIGETYVFNTKASVTSGQARVIITIRNASGSYFRNVMEKTTDTAQDLFGTFAIPSDFPKDGYLQFNFYCTGSANGSGDVEYSDIQLERNSVTTYEPYTASTFPISWTQQGTVYGGYVDLVSGELVKEWERQFVDKNSQIGIFPWGGIMTDSVSGQEYASVLFRRGSLDRPINNVWQYCYCDKLPLASGRVINTAYMYDGDTYGACISLPTSLIGTTIEEVEAYMENNTFDFVYKLRIPIRYQLTPTQIKTLKGINNVYSDADSAEVTYYKHNNDTYQHMAADAIISNDNFVIITDDKYVIGNNQDYITY